MPNRIQTLRSSVSGNRPASGTRQPGELYVNFPDGQLGVVNAAQSAQDLIAVRYFSSLANYNVNDTVVYNSRIYVANVAITPGPFNASQWISLANINDLTAQFDQSLPLAGGTMVGPLILNADPTAALGAVTKQYVDAIGASTPGRNRLINGDFRVNQWAGVGTVTPTNTQYVADRWKASLSSAARFTTQTTQPNAGVVNALNVMYIASTGAYTPVATDYFALAQAIEYVNIGDLQWGSALAAPVVLSFWCATTVAGTYSGSLTNNGGTRSYPFTFTVPSNVWTFVSIPILGDTQGTWNPGTTNALGLNVRFELGGGANFRAPAGAWTNGNFPGANGAASLVATSGASLRFANIQLEKGTVATPFDWKTQSDIFLACQRYFVNIGAAISCVGYGTGAGIGAWVNWEAPTQMRATPTITASWGSGSNAIAQAISMQPDTRTLVSSITAAAAGIFSAILTINSLNAEL